MIKVSITDDHFMVLQGIQTMLNEVSGIRVLFISETAADTLFKLETELPDVLLVDINLPDENGFELSKKIRVLFPSVKIIALTNYEDISFVKQMIHCGAKGYLLKNTHREELVAAIETVMAGKEYLQPSIQAKIIEQSLGKKKQNFLTVRLTKREKEVLLAISEEMTTQEISQKLFISPKTVETHRANLMSKLGAKNSVGIIKNAIEKGLL